MIDASEPGDPSRSAAALVGVAAASAFGCHLGEAVIAAVSDNAALDVLSGADRWRYLLAIVAAFPVLTAVGATLGWLASRGRAAAGPAVAAATPALVVAVEAARHADEVRGPGAFGLAGWAAVVAVVATWWATSRRLDAAPSGRRRGVAGVVVAAAMLVLVRPALERGPATAATAAAAPVVEPPTSTLAPKHLLVLLVDTLRADHLGCYGYERDTSPRLDAFATRGVRFENAVTPKPKTSPAVASFFTGLFPSSHGIHATSTVLPDEHRTLAELLRDRGFATLGVSANINVNPGFGFDQGFDEFIQVKPIKENRRVVRDKDAERLRDHLLEWLDRRGDERWFAYLQFIDPHAPYGAPEPYRDMFRGDAHDGRFGVRDDLPIRGGEPIDAIEPHVFDPEIANDLDGYVARYDGEIRYTDTIVGEILDALGERGLADDTLVVFTADHGEALVDHDVYFHHGMFPYDEQVRIPLVVRGPGVARDVVRPHQVSLVGLMPTLAQAMGVESPDWVEEPGFADLLSPGDHEERDWTFLSSRTGRSLTEGVRGGGYKYLERKRGVSPDEMLSWENLLLPGKRVELSVSRVRQHELTRELYDLDEDPGERDNLAWRRPDVTSRYAETLARFRDRERRDWPKPARLKGRDLTGEVAEELEQLGYGR